MSPRIIGPSGVELEVDREMARGLVRDGFAELANGEPKSSLDRPAPSNVLNPEASPAVALPVGNSVSDVVHSTDPDAGVDGQPRGNASRDEWVAYALANGKTEDDVQGLKQTEIRALFAVPETPPTGEPIQPPETPASGAASTPSDE